MNYCPHCNNPLAEGAQFCVFCGKSVAPPTPKPAFCYKCGKSLEAGARFCVFCGANLDILPVVQPAAPAPQPVVIPEPQTSLQPVEEEPVCPQCGTAYEANSLFCFHCGARREDVPASQTALAEEPIPATAEEVPAAPAVVEEPPVAAAPVPQPPKKKKQTGAVIGIVAAVLLLVVGMFLLGGPGIPMGHMFDGISPTATPDPVEVQLSVGVEEWEQGWLEERVAAFNEQHPEYILTVDIIPLNPQDANGFAGDPRTAPDVYMYTAECLPDLLNAGSLAPVDGEYLNDVRNSNGTSLVNSLTGPDGQVYGFPYSPNTWFMYYDKSVFSEEDIGSLEAMLEKGGVSFPVTNSWYLGAFYAAGGATYFGPQGINASAGVQLYHGDGITLYLTDLMKHPNFYAETDSQGHLQMMVDGQISACFSGSWMLPIFSEIWGKNMGVAALPTIQFDGSRQLKAFASAYGIGVNPYAENLDAAYAFAAFLASEESQLARYEQCGVYPTNLNLPSNPTIAADPVAVALIEVTGYTSIVQPTIPEMQYYWDPMTRLGNMIANGEVTSKNASAVIAEIEAAMNGG